jgi:hypothetical protein
LVKKDLGAPFFPLFSFFFRKRKKRGKTAPGDISPMRPRDGKRGSKNTPQKWVKNHPIFTLKNSEKQVKNSHFVIFSASDWGCIKHTTFLHPVLGPLL